MIDHNQSDGGRPASGVTAHHTGNLGGKTRLPGFTKIYLLQTYAMLAFLLCMAVLIFALAYWALDFVLAMAFIAFAVWPLSCIISVHKRSRSAAGLCFSLAVGSLILAVIATVIMLIQGIHSHGGYYSLQQVIILAMLLSGLPIGYAWTRYFRISGDMARAFGLPPRLEDAPAAGLTIFRIFCASVLLVTLGANLTLSAVTLADVGFFDANRLWKGLFMGLYCLPQTVFPLLGLILVRPGLPGLAPLGGLGNQDGPGWRDGQGRLGLYRFIGLWIIVYAVWEGVFNAPHALLPQPYHESAEFFRMVSSIHNIPLHKALLVFTLLLFLWKFAVSSEDRAWIDARPPFQPGVSSSSGGVTAQPAGPPETKAGGKGGLPRRPLAGPLLGAALLLGYIIAANITECIFLVMLFLRSLPYNDGGLLDYYALLRPLLPLVLVLLAARALYLLLERKRSSIPVGMAAMVFGLLATLISYGYLDLKSLYSDIRTVKIASTRLLPVLWIYAAGLYYLVRMRSGTPKNQPPLAVTALQFFCGLIVARTALPEITAVIGTALNYWKLGSYFQTFNGGNVPVTLLLCVLSGLALPLISIWSVRRANYSRGAILTTLYLWMVLLLSKAAAIQIFSSRWPGGASYESQLTFLGLSALIWYFHSSGEAEEWFGKAPGCLKR